MACSPRILKSSGTCTAKRPVPTRHPNTPVRKYGNIAAPPMYCQKPLKTQRTLDDQDEAALYRHIIPNDVQKKALYKGHAGVPAEMQTSWKLDKIDCTRACPRENTLVCIDPIRWFSPRNINERGETAGTDSHVHQMYRPYKLNMQFKMLLPAYPPAPLRSVSRPCCQRPLTPRVSESSLYTCTELSISWHDLPCPVHPLIATTR